MSKKYTVEINAQIIISLLKSHGISKVIASPGTTNMALVASMDSDPFFEMYSAVDERSAAYIATGLAAESGEPVVISCTGATASRNYASGLTEAYYRKLPILAITSTQQTSKIGHLVAQTIDRSSIQNDISRFAVELPFVTEEDKEALWDCEIKVNQAILELKRHGGGPVHINLPTCYNQAYDVTELPRYRRIDRLVTTDEFPNLPKSRIAILVGSHNDMSNDLTNSIDRFCACHDAVVFCDHTSGYYGKYRVPHALICGQTSLKVPELKAGLIIHIGEVSGNYYSNNVIGPDVWRVSEDGEIRDTFRKLRNVFEMSSKVFFDRYTFEYEIESELYYKSCMKILQRIQSKIPELPLSNPWIASSIARKIPDHSVLHFGILNSLRSWNFFELADNVRSYCNVGGFGIDGCLSSAVGASLANKEKLYYIVIGDLAFFYDMNVLGNRHLGNNLRILLVNNGKGTEFRHTNHPAGHFGETADKYIAAAGHFGKKSPSLVKNYVQDLGLEYLQASTKEDFKIVSERFLEANITESAIVLEVFTESDNESLALETILALETNIKGKAAQIAGNVIGAKGIKAIKGVINRK